MIPPPPTSTLFPYTTLFRSSDKVIRAGKPNRALASRCRLVRSNNSGESWVEGLDSSLAIPLLPRQSATIRSEEHTSELQSPYDLVCRLLLEKKKKSKKQIHT